MNSQIEKRNTRWIENRMPCADGLYIITTYSQFKEDVKVTVDIFSNGRWLTTSDDEVIAWMELPKPYRP